MPHPPCGNSVMSTQVRWTNPGSCAALETISVNSLTTPSCLSRSRTLTGVRTLNSNVVTVSGCIRHGIGGQIVNKSRGVIEQQGNRWNSLPAHDRFREVLRELVFVQERSGRGIDVDHRHKSAFSLLA